LSFKGRNIAYLFRLSLFLIKGWLTASTSLSTNHRVRVLIPLWGPRSKSYFRGKDELRKEFSIARAYLTCFNYRLSYQSAGRKYLSFKTSLSSHDTSEVDSLPNTRLTYTRFAQPDHLTINQSSQLAR